MTPKSEHRYAARGTNPLHARTSPARQIAMLPLKAVYDHQYGRWYALGFTRVHGLSAWRMEGMSGLAIGGAADPELFARKREQLDARLRTSWLVDLGEPTRVSVRFFRPEGRSTTSSANGCCCKGNGARRRRKDRIRSGTTSR